MLKRFYANNYRCLVNFEINFERLTLLLGPNGGGKSTIFDLLFSIRRLLVDNARIDDVFSDGNFTSWVDSLEQSFELEVQGPEGLYTYRLVLEHNPEIKKQRINHESLFLKGNPLFEFNQGKVYLYHDDHKPGPVYNFDWTVSALATVVPAHDNKKLTWFKEWVESLFIVALQPKAMVSVTEEDSIWLNRDGTNFASWYTYISQEYPDKTHQLIEQLRESIPGFHVFKLEKSGKQKILKVGFVKQDNGPLVTYYEFDHLSDGQRVIIVLYSLLLGLRDMGHTIFIDEPTNYVALSEIQPWLMELADVCGERFPQAVLISHHPELIDYFGSESGKWIDREPLGPTRVKKLTNNGDPQLKLSELISRGWEE